MHLFAASWPIWDQFKNLIFAALTYLYALTGDWGVAIILLTDRDQNPHSAAHDQADGFDV